MMVLSIMSLTAYLCGFDFSAGSSVTYMLYLIYYRASQCHSVIDWSLLNGINTNVSVIIQGPSETEAVFRTYVFSWSYLVFSILLVITCVLALGESLN